MALALSAVGIVGVVSYGVARRRQEIGVRVALGATPRAVGVLVVRGGLAPVAAGAVVGASVSLFFARVLADFLFGVQTRDGATLVATAVILPPPAAPPTGFPPGAPRASIRSPRCASSGTMRRV